jgi:hypothetical protein
VRDYQLCGVPWLAALQAGVLYPPHLLPGALLAARQRGLALVALALGGMGVLFAMGPATTLFELYRSLPLLGSFRYPTKVLFTTDFCFALAAGAGLDALLRAVARRPAPARVPCPRPWPLWIAGAVAAALAIPLAIAGSPRASLASGLLAALALAATAARRLPAAVVGGLVVALALVELLSGTPWGRLLYRDERAMRAFHEELELYRTAAEEDERVWIVLADTYAPGWRAFVDGEEAPIHPVNHLFRGVALEAGAHRVRFEYRPRSVLVGAAVSLGALAVWLALAAKPLARAAIRRGVRR